MAEPDHEDSLEQAIALHDAGKLAEAETAYLQILAQHPEDADVLELLGRLNLHLGRNEQAIDALTRATSLDPENIDALFTLAFTFRSVGNWDDAIDTYLRLLKIQPEHVPALNNLASAYKDTGELDQSLACYGRVLQVKPDPMFHSSRLFVMHFHPDYGPERLLAEHQAWDRAYAPPLAASRQPHANNRDADRKLRIGYVSADFRDHPVGLAIEPLLACHDRGQFDVVCFHSGPTKDAVTERIRSLPIEWHPIFAVADSQVADLIREKKIDILIDLSLHMAHNRMPLFARKPAPVQATYLGYPSTTGVATINYRISDPHLDPEGTDRFYVEKTLHLPRTYLCWRWNGADEPVRPPPCVDSGQITFASLNNFCKVTPATLEAWGRLISRVKNSRLLLRCPPGRTAERVLQSFAAAGVEPTRIEFIGRLPWAQYVELLHRQDIALDPFPYPGHTTSLDALWMGVPVVTLAGQTAASRGGVSILSNLGLIDLIAPSADQYIDIAAKLAGDLPRLKTLRSSLRDRINNSALTDAPGVTGELESLYRQMWRDWCAANS